MIHPYAWFTLAVGAARFRVRRTWALSPEARDLRLLRRELRRLERDPEFAGAWRAELAEGWRRIEFDRALSKICDDLVDDGDPS
ncbi:hypothetical protein [Streptomyces sp. NPDC020965]|uniref:hypothetical protein n=1 Tax=Streptomyces sp. NPDC020965 TaxID=3365105 RepID=UPI0037BB2BF4